MRKTIIITLLACLVLSLAFSAALAQSNNDPVVIIPYLPEFQPPETVYSDQEIILGARWGACRSGLFNGFFSAVHLDWSLKLDGEGEQLFDPPLDVAEYWGPIEPTDNPNVIYCKGHPESILVSPWRYNQGTLPAGDYVLYLHYWLDHPVIDGADYDPVDGRPDKYEGSLQEDTISIHVEVRP